MEQAKLQYVRKIQDTATRLAEMSHALEDIEAIWNARLYGPGTANQFSDTELAALDAMGMRSCTADDLYGFVIFCAQFKLFMTNGVPAQRDNLANVQHLRTDI